MMKNFLLLCFCAITLCISSCSTCVSGEGEPAIHVLQLPPVKGIRLDGSWTVILKQGAQQDVRVNTHKNILPLINQKVEDGMWIISLKDCVNENVEFTVTLPDVDLVSVEGSGDIKGEGAFNAEVISVRVDGSGSVSLNVNAQKVISHVNGSGDISLAGSSTIHDVVVEGSGDVHAEDLAAGTSKAAVKGSGNARVNVSAVLDATIEGSGSIQYTGNPKVQSAVNGSGEVEKL